MFDFNFYSCNTVLFFCNTKGFSPRFLSYSSLSCRNLKVAVQMKDTALKKPTNKTTVGTISNKKKLKNKEENWEYVGSMEVMTIPCQDKVEHFVRQISISAAHVLNKSRNLKRESIHQIQRETILITIAVVENAYHRICGADRQHRMVGSLLLASLNNSIAEGLVVYL